MVRGLLHAFLAVAALVAAELFAALVLERRRLVSVWEAQWGSAYLAPTLALVALAAALVGLFLFELARRGESRSARVVLGAIAAAGGVLVAHGVSGGRHLSTLPARGGFALALAGAGFASVYLLAPRFARLLRSRPGLAAASLAAALVGLWLIDRFVLVRLYPAFHTALSVLALLTAPAAALALAGQKPSTRGERIALGLCVLAVAGAAFGLEPAARRLSRFDNFRMVMSQAAPLAGEGIALAARVAPPPPIAEGECKEDDCLPASKSGQRTLDWRGKDLLLISVDALRADHVSSYGYARKTTPALDALAEQGVRFTHAYAPTPHTSYSVTSLMTGKYMRPLLLQGAGTDSDTWASLLRTYGYRTAAFYPPAVFFIDPDRFVPFRDGYLGFEYRKVEFMEGQGRVDQVVGYLAAESAERRQFVWVHLFGPHEPYEAHPGHTFGDQDLDRYDSEIAAADETVGQIVAKFRELRPGGVVIVTADHGEEFGDHGGRYHGTTVYEEQVRVPLVIFAPGTVARAEVAEVVQTIDLLPTVLAALDIPRPPRIRGRDLGPLLSQKRPPEPGLALAETEELSLIARGDERLVCQRKLGACQLFDVRMDPGETRDLASERAGHVRELRARLRELGASHGRYETQGLRAEGKGWPAPILRGISGDGDAAEDIATLLDDADPAIRRKAAQVLFELRRPESAGALRLALTRDEDPEVKRWAALGLTRLDQGAPLVYEIQQSDELEWKRLASLALAETGDKRGEAVLIAWWKDAGARDFTRSRELLDALAKIKSKDAVHPLTQSLGDVRLRPYIAQALARIGDEAGRVPLVRAFAVERYQGARVAIANALVELRAETAMAEPLVRFLGVPDPLPGGLDIARRAGILQHVGGPDPKARDRLERQSSIGVRLELVVPRGGNGSGVRLLVRARSQGQPGELRVGAPAQKLEYDRSGQPTKTGKVPQIHAEHQVRLTVPAGEPSELAVTLPESLGARPGRPLELVFFGDARVAVESAAVVPLADELPPPPPEPWRAGDPRENPDGGPED